MTKDVKLVVVGSIGIDSIETPEDKKDGLLGGSASYACAAASYFTATGMVGVVGTDFPDAYRQQYVDFGIDLAGLQVEEGKTFHWSGVYEENMNNRRTVCTDLNVFGDFSPRLPEAYTRAPFLFLANIGPDLQLHVLDQIEKPRFVVADTMDLWINTARETLLDVTRRVDLLTLNEFEARHLSGEQNLLRAARALLALGPDYVLIKKGEHGSVLFSPDRIFLIPAFPLEDVRDPTGAGDSFAGGFMGSLSTRKEVNEAEIRKSMLYGGVVASFGVEAFSLDRFNQITIEDIEERASLFREMIRVE